MPNKPKKAKPYLKFVVPLFLLMILFGLVFILFFKQSSFKSSAVKVGLNVELTGQLSGVGNASKNGANLALRQINDQGGVLVNGSHYPLVFEVVDNGSDVDQTRDVTQQLIDDPGVLAIIGPNIDKYAVISSTLAQTDKILMVSPWSTDPQTTLGKQYVYRATFLDPFQGGAQAIFARRNLNLRRAAVFYNTSPDILKEQADHFQNKFADLGGSVVDVETFKSNDSDFSPQLKKIQKNYPQAIFLPAYLNDAVKVIKQAKNLKIMAIFLGSDAWGGQQIIDACGADCDGTYLSARFAPDSKDPKVVQFVQDYQKAYNMIPDDVAALSYDSVNLVVQALQKSQDTDRGSVAKAMATTGEFDGVSGLMRFSPGSGDPKKSVAILKIQDGKMNWVTNIEPN